MNVNINVWIMSHTEKKPCPLQSVNGKYSRSNLQTVNLHKNNQHKDF